MQKLLKHWKIVMVLLFGLLAFFAGMTYFAKAKFDKINKERVVDSLNVKVDSAEVSDSFFKPDRPIDSTATPIDNNIQITPIPPIVINNCDKLILELKTKMTKDSQVAKDSLIAINSKLNDKVKNLETYIKLQDKQIEKLRK